MDDWIREGYRHALPPILRNVVGIDSEDVPEKLAYAIFEQLTGSQRPPSISVGTVYVMCSIAQPLGVAFEEGAIGFGDMRGESIVRQALGALESDFTLDMTIDVLEDFGWGQGWVPRQTTWSGLHRAAWNELHAKLTARLIQQMHRWERDGVLIKRTKKAS